MTTAVILLGIAFTAIMITSGRRLSYARVTKSLAATMSAITLAAVAFVPGASAASQAPLIITNSVHSTTVGTSIVLTATGGSGTGALSFKATGAGCVITAKTNALSATQPTSCSVVATKAADKNFSAANSSAVVFTFTGINQAAFSIANAVTTSIVGSPITVTTKGGSGAGLVTFAVTGTACSMKAAVLSAASMATCVVTATKAAAGTYNAAVSAPVTFTFNPAKYTIVNAIHAGTVGTPLTVVAVGGTAKGTNFFSVTGSGCSIDSSTGVLTASAAATCVVTATLKSGTKVVATATAVSFSFTVENPTVAHPDVAALVSVSGTTGAQINDTVLGRANFINQYYNNNDHWYVNYLAGGASVSLTWHVTGSNGLALVNAPVTLHGNLDYSCATGTTWSVAGLNVFPGCGADAEGTLAGTTDANGNVTFTFTNTNAVAGSNPSDMTTTSGVTANESSTFPWTDMLLQVKNDTYVGDPKNTVNQGTDRVDFVIIPGTGANANSPTVAKPDVASLTSVTGAASAKLDNTILGDQQFIKQYYNNNDHWYGYYIAPGATIKLTWHVTGSAGKALANAPVTLRSNLQYGCAQGVTWSQDSLNNYAGCQTGVEGTLSGTTDANGNVTFTLNNTNTDKGTPPSDTTTASLLSANEQKYSWTNMLLQVGNDTYTGDPTATVNQGADRVDFIVSPTPAVQTAPSHANPDVATMTGITGSVNQPIDFTSNGDQWFIDATYSTLDHWNFTYVTAGSTVNETWHVVDFNGNAMANTTVTLETGFAGSGGGWTATGIDANGYVSGTTDANGNVTFALTNTNSSAPAQTGGNTDGWAALGALSTNPWSRMALVVGTPIANAGLDASLGAVGSSTDVITATSGSTVTQATDLVDLIVVAPSNAPAPTTATYANPDVATMTGITGSVNQPIDFTSNGDQWFIDATYSHGDHWNFTYVTAGSTVNETWHVVDFNGNAMANTKVTLMTGFAGTDSNWTATGIDANGYVSGTTDANGNVTFALTNTDSSAPAQTGSNTDGWAALGALSTNPWSRMALVVGTPIANAGLDGTVGAVGSSTDVITAGAKYAASTVNQATDLVDLIVVG